MQKFLSEYSRVKKQTGYIAHLELECDLPKHAERMFSCGSNLGFYSDAKNENRVCYRRFACHDRYCPLCQHLYAKEHEQKLDTMFSWLMNQRTKAGNPKYSFIFVTPTVPDVDACDEIAVRNTLNGYGQALSRLINSTAIRGWGHHKSHGTTVYYHGIALGVLRKNELTINTCGYTRSGLEANIHSHLVFVVHGSYFHSKYYMDHQTWVKLWQRCCGTSKPLDIHVEKPYYKQLIKVNNGHYKFKNVKVYGRRGYSRAMSHATKEMVKYEVKSQDFIRVMKDKRVPKHKVYNCFEVIRDAYYRKPRITMYGIVRTANRMYNRNEIDTFSPRYRNNVQFTIKLRCQYDWAKSLYHVSKSLMSDYDKIFAQFKYHSAPTKLSKPYTYEQKHEIFTRINKANAVANGCNQKSLPLDDNDYNRLKDEFKSKDADMVAFYNHKKDLLNAELWVQCPGVPAEDYDAIIEGSPGRSRFLNHTNLHKFEDFQEELRRHSNSK